MYIRITFQIPVNLEDFLLNLSLIDVVSPNAKDPSLLYGNKTIK